MSYTATTWVDGETPVNAENLNNLEQGVAALHTAMDSGALTGAPGKSAYAYAQEAGFTGTEEEFAQQLTGGVSSWNDLTDKPFGEEGSTEVLLEAQSFTSVLDEEFGYAYASPNTPFQFVLGETYSVIWDGAVYECEARDASAIIPGAVFVGNASLLELPHNDEPFAIATVGTTMMVMCVTDTAPTEHTVAIAHDIVTVKPLDARFLPMNVIDERIEAYIGAALEGEY